MVAVVASIAQAAALATLHPAAQAAALGYPATLFGFAPDQREYWHEPGLPWFTKEMWDNPPLTYLGLSSIPAIGHIAGDNMAPRFPKGCSINSMPVCHKENLVIGRVYVYRFKDQATEGDQEAKEWQYSIARLVKIGGNYLEVKADNNPTPALWMLRDDPCEAVWEVWEVTHYATYPGESEQKGAARE